MELHYFTAFAKTETATSGGRTGQPVQDGGRAGGLPGGEGRGQRAERTGSGERAHQLEHVAIAPCQHTVRRLGTFTDESRPSGGIIAAENLVMNGTGGGMAPPAASYTSQY